jgi:hypothetical protein
MEPMQRTAPLGKSILLGAALLLLAGCGDDEPTGPEFGDLQFSPASPVLVGLAREYEMELRNVSGESRGPLIIGAGTLPLSVPRGSTCPGLVVDVTPSQMNSMAAGASETVTVTFSFAGLTEDECPLSMYEVDLNVATSQLVLESAQLLVDHPQLE